MNEIILNVDDISINVNNFLNIFAIGAFISCWIIPILCMCIDYMLSDKCFVCDNRNFIPDENVLICSQCKKIYKTDFRGKIQKNIGEHQ